MMKGTIAKNANAEVELVLKEFIDKMITKRDLTFSEKKKPQR